MCMHIIAGQCLSTSIDYCSRAFLFFPSFTLSPSPLSSLFFLSFPSHLSPLFFFFASLPPFLSFFTLPFPTPPFHPISPFPPISSSLIPPLFSLRSLLSLGASFPSNPLFLSYSSNPFFFLPLHSFLPLYSFLSLFSILSLLSILPLHSFLPFHSFLSLLSIIYPSSPSYPSFSSSPSFLHIPHLLVRYLPFNISFLPLLPTTPSLPTPPFFPTLYRFIPTPSFSCLPPSIRFPLLFATSTFILTPPSLPLSLPHPLPSLSPFPPSPFHPLIIPSAFHLPPSFALLHSLSPYKLSPSLFLPHSLSLSLPLTSHPTERYLSLSFSSLSLFFFPSFHLYPFLILLPLHLFPTSLSPSLPSLGCVLCIAQ